LIKRSAESVQDSFFFSFLEALCFWCWLKKRKKKKKNEQEFFSVKNFINFNLILI